MDTGPGVARFARPPATFCDHVVVEGSVDEHVSGGCRFARPPATFCDHVVVVILGVLVGIDFLIRTPVFLSFLLLRVN
ncbi:hypothetical protein Poly41_55660 [Novipirellula artificiosorum]|uniref:Uncharacterized protein n=1 Tax=Novipirellula artificiosorum TaxID=2528016 RepID=A0A5C6D6Z0_9BACT|nr:hypothetical protein Poly41_55660 [Novipirellula artificiosorum]